MARPYLASRLALGISALAALGAFPRTARAGGYDTPILYSARHMGMGGTAIGYVNDPSAMFHNPAGLGGVQGLEVMADFSPLTGSITSSPGSGADGASKAADGTYPSRTTTSAISPLFLVGAAYRIAEPVTLGLGFYPVAAAAGEYELTDALGKPFIDKTRLVFLELSPGLSVELMKGLYLGAGYRITTATLERVRGATANPTEFNFEVKGTDATGVRVGVQYFPTENFSVGLVYRHRIEPKLTGDKVVAINSLVDGKTSLILPSKLGLGLSGRMDRLHGALDLEYGFYSQNSNLELTGYNPVLNKTERTVNYFEWQNAITARVGLEYSLGAESQFPVRVGYVFDGKVGNKAYPTAFGTPPAPSNSFTVGGGFRAEKWQTNLAFAYRIASTEVTAADVIGAADCASCSKPGHDYTLKIMGFYLDVSYRFDVAPLFGGAPSAAPPPAAPAAVPAPAAPTDAPPPAGTSPSPAPGPTPP